MKYAYIGWTVFGKLMCGFNVRYCQFHSKIIKQIS